MNISSVLIAILHIKFKNCTLSIRAISDNFPLDISGEGLLPEVLTNLRFGDYFKFIALMKSVTLRDSLLANHFQ